MLRSVATTQSNTDGIVKEFNVEMVSLERRLVLRKESIGLKKSFAFVRQPVILGDYLTSYL